MKNVFAWSITSNNPHYANGGSIQDKINQGVLDPVCASIFKDKWGLEGQSDKTLKLRKQEQAISFAKNDQSYVVTTGTGSENLFAFSYRLSILLSEQRKQGVKQKQERS